MSIENLFAVLLALAVGGVVIYWIAYHTGRMHGYHSGLEKGAKMNSQVQHLRGMSDGYVMAMQHTPGQRNEYMNNVLLKTGAITKADIEAERRLRWRLQTEE